MLIVVVIVNNPLSFIKKHIARYWSLWNKNTKERKKKEEIMSKKGEVICVTGGSGCIGSWLVRLLLDRGYTVHATAKNLSKLKKRLVVRPILLAVVVLLCFANSLSSDFELKRMKRRRSI